MGSGVFNPEYKGEEFGKEQYNPMDDPNKKIADEIIGRAVGRIPNKEIRPENKLSMREQVEFSRLVFEMENWNVSRDFYRVEGSEYLLQRRTDKNLNFEDFLRKHHYEKNRKPEAQGGIGSSLKKIFDRMRGR